ncbi:hypothetical protein FNH22_19035 [Fulvivirga sp. M361]|uniref:hypothetical protein n=1 Tax=Fulvivirga sp. M361 TaxID=2594266 RepID=UPI00117B9681|nr:hypothetical protein [Fulvivirga sp. M361]TRX54850.1 hypothetical protein FNH22_19035 [Fulvivirga sp. M361]
MNIQDKIKHRRVYAVEDFPQEDSTDDTETVEEGNDAEYEDPAATVQNDDVSEYEYALEETAQKPVNMPSDSEDIFTTTRSEVDIITTYVLGKGKKIPEQVCQLIVSHKLSELLLAHGQLCELIKPSTPESILYLRQYLHSKPYLFSPIPLARNFIVIALLSVTLLLGIGLSEDVNSEILSKGILNNSGLPLLKNLVFLCSGAGIGTVFFLLSKLTKEVKEATLVKNDITYYYAMLIMGILSGLIMSEMIVLNQSNLDGQSVEMNRLLFALLGGFSSELVYGMLQAIVNRLRTIVGAK